jgi:hypothetical protein
MGTVVHVVYTKRFLFLRTDFVGDAQEHFEICAVFLPLCMAAMTVKVMHTRCKRIFGCDLNQRFPFFSFKLCKHTVISLFYSYPFFRVVASAHCVSDKERSHILREKWALLLFLLGFLC